MLKPACFPYTVDMVFEQKTIGTETLGQYLKAIRLQKELEYVAVAKTVGISPKFMEALEKGAWDVLPADVYVQGFLHKIAELYGISSSDLVAQFKKEKGLFQGQQQRLSVRDKSLLPKMQLTPRMLSGLIIGGLLLALAAYVVWQVARLNQPPNLEVYEPEDGQKITQTFVTISGHTDPGMKLTINEEQVLVDDAGKFSANLGISSGQKQLVIRSQNKFDKTTTRIINVVGELPVTGDQSQVFTLDIFALQRITLKLIADGKAEEVKILEPGQTQKISAQTTILLSTSDAGSTQVLLDGKNFGVLGKPGEALTLVPFTATTKEIVTSRPKNPVAPSKTTPATTTTSGESAPELTPE